MEQEDIIRNPNKKVRPDKYNQTGKEFSTPPVVPEHLISQFIKENEAEGYKKTIRKIGRPYPPCLECSDKAISICALSGAECFDFKNFVARSESAGFGRITEMKW